MSSKVKVTNSSAPQRSSLSKNAWFGIPWLQGGKQIFAFLPINWLGRLKVRFRGQKYSEERTVRLSRKESLESTLRGKKKILGRGSLQGLASEYGRLSVHMAYLATAPRKASFKINSDIFGMATDFKTFQFIVPRSNRTAYVSGFLR